MNLDGITQKQLQFELVKRTARRDLLTFMQFNWTQPGAFAIGRHTKAICDRLTRAVEDWKQGKSTFLLIAVPFRHGKSEIASIALPAFFLGSCRQLEPSVIMSGYGATLIEGFSKRVQRMIQDAPFQALFPNMQIEGTAANWNVSGSHGTVTAVGLGGAITGKGGHLIVLDDYCKSRAEAVSQTFRNKTWDSFRNDLMTRQNAPANIVVVTATPWHVDDIRGRIKKLQAEDPKFPQFEEMNFPARKAGEYEYLFPELLPPRWYDAQRATLQKQAAALLDCNPIVEGGERFNVDKVVVHTSLDGWPKLREVRGWDLASSAKQRDKDNPDRTWGIRGAVRDVHLGSGVHKKELWIRSMVCCREEAPTRDAIIRSTAQQDGAAVPQYVEAFAAYKDAYTQLRAALRGHIVRASRLPGDKSAKCAPLESVFEAGDVHVYLDGCKQFFDLWRSEFAAFPAGEHDDSCDATAVMFHAFDGNGSTAIF